MRIGCVSPVALLGRSIALNLWLRGALGALSSRRSVLRLGFCLTPSTRKTVSKRQPARLAGGTGGRHGRARMPRTTLRWSRIDVSLPCFSRSTDRNMPPELMTLPVARVTDPVTRYHLGGAGARCGPGGRCARLDEARTRRPGAIGRYFGGCGGAGWCAGLDLRLHPCIP